MKKLILFVLFNLVVVYANAQGIEVFKEKGYALTFKNNDVNLDPETKEKNDPSIF